MAMPGSSLARQHGVLGAARRCVVAPVSTVALGIGANRNFREPGGRVTTKGDVIWRAESVGTDPSDGNGIKGLDLMKSANLVVVLRDLRDRVIFGDSVASDMTK